jgi:hypothetical protein
MLRMLRTLSVVVLALAMSIGVAQARHVIPGCAVGQPAAAKCTCGTAANHRPLLCHPGQWCHASLHCTHPNHL